MGTNKEVKINLIANEYQARNRRRKTWAMLFLAFASTLVFMLGVYNYYQKGLEGLTWERQRLKESCEQSQILLQGLQTPSHGYLQLKSNSVQTAQHIQASTLDLLDVIEKTLPSAIALSEISIESDRIIVKGSSSSHNQEALWLNGLKEQHLFQELLLLDSKWHESKEEVGFELVLARAKNQPDLE